MSGSSSTTSTCVTRSSPRAGPRAGTSLFRAANPCAGASREGNPGTAAAVPGLIESRGNASAEQMIRAWIIVLTCTAAVGGATPESGGSEPVTPLEPIEQLDPGKVELGRKLFHDARLSHGNALACA